AKASRDQAAAAAITPALRDQAAAAEASVQRVRIEADRLESEERAAREQIEELKQRLRLLATDLERERTLLRDSADTLGSHRAEQATLVAESEGHGAERSKASARLEHAESALMESERLMAEAATALADLRARRSRAQIDADEAATREARLHVDREQIKEERDGLSTDDTNGLSDALLAQELAVQALAEAEKATVGAEAATAASRDLAAALQAEQTKAEAGLVRMQTEAAALRSLLPVSDVQSPLIESVEARQGTEFALAALLDDELNLSANPEDDAFWLQIDGAADAALPHGVRKLSDFVDAPAELARRLNQTGIVNADEGAQLQKTLRPGQTLVSREGDLWRWDGLVASSATRQNAAERMSGRRRLAELVIGIAESQPAVVQGATQLRVARQASEAAALEESRSREAWRMAQKELDAARNEIVAAEREQTGRASRLAALAEADTRLTADIEEVAANRKAAAELLQHLVLPSAIETPMEALRQKVAADRDAVAEARMSISEIDRAGQARDARIVSLKNEEAAWTNRRAEVENQIASLEERREIAAGQREILNGKPEAIASQRVALMERAGEAEATRSSAGDALAEAEAALASADKSSAEANQRLSATREQRGRLEERLGGAKERLAEIGERIREALQCEPAEAAELAGLSGDNLPALDQVEARLERLKQERERLGGVNLQADGEAEELASRRDGMVVERDDLVAAINKLRQGIGSLNREGRERLTSAFENVNREFQRLFVHLFGGGTAELKLVGSDDPLEAGLEIIAKPPGKKPQTMTLLSGGEQALTALSLIFAVFLTNPAPVCVLDEVDAPLDDANVERLCALLDEITRETDTRFLVITHNPITMARMNRLFGVTMTERGVSQLVSVDLETAEQFLEAS
ncbi:MAG: chromosome segregation protein SMC, partial [Alphaproteobacteria bacterium]